MIFNGKNGNKLSKELKTLSVEMARQVSGGSMGGGDKRSDTSMEDDDPRAFFGIIRPETSMGDDD